MNDFVSLFTGLKEIVEQATPFATTFVIVVWWLERQERLRLQKERDSLLERVVIALTQTAESVKTVTEAVRNVTGLVARRGR